MSNRLEGVRYTTLIEPNLRQAKTSVLVAAEFAGSARYLIPVAKLLSEKNNVYFQTRGPAEEIINIQFKRNAVEMDTLPPFEWTLVSGGENLGFEVAAARLAQKVAVAEDSPTSIGRVIDALLQNGIEPSLVLAITRRQAEVYRERYAGRNFPVIPIGQPDFDRLHSEDAAALAEEARQILKISPKSRVVTYIGFRGEVVQGKIPSGGYPDFDSYILTETARAIRGVALSHPDEKFIYINRPHPGLREELWRNPSLEEYTQTEESENLRVISLSKQEWEASGLTTRQITAASGVVANIGSTVGQEVALAGANQARRKMPIGAVPLYILPGNAVEVFWSGEFALGRTGSVAVAESVESIEETIERALFDSEYRGQIAQSQQELLSEFRFTGSATGRVPLWMRAVDRYGFDVAKALNVFKR